MKKTCRKCGIEKDISEFQQRKSTKDGYRNECKVCRAAYDATYYSKPENKERRLKIQSKRYHANPEAFAKRHRYLLYGILPSEVERLLEFQSDSCAICGESFNDHTSHIDHDHFTGKVRGILCSNCNSALGLVHDNLNILGAMIVYLKVSKLEDHYMDGYLDE